jgi:3',5'-cyclic AMP phosphodiesterase CpdA
MTYCNLPITCRLAITTLAMTTCPVKAQIPAPELADALRRYPAAAAYRPTPLPDRVILTWSDDPATTQAVTWRTSTAVSNPIAQIARAEAGPGFDPIDKRVKPGPDKITTINAVTEPLVTDLSTAHYHSVTFTGLRPATQYVYRVGDGVNWSEWFQFETANDKPAPFDFIYLGDAQNDVKRHWSRVVRGAYSDMPKAKLIVHAGDLINRGLSDAEWGEWHAAAGWINGMVPSLPTPGNHEYAVLPKSADAPDDWKPVRQLVPHWRPQFTLPQNGPTGLKETVYYIDVQGVRFISLNSNEQQAEQVDWMKQVFANNPCRWTIVTFHHPIYSTAKGRDNKRLRELWRPVFDQYTPDLVLQGHDHTYGRSGLMREDNLLTGVMAKERGTVYVVSVSGPKMYTLQDDLQWPLVKARDTQLYQLIRINGDRLHYESRTAMGELYDEFELRKRNDGRNDLIEREQLEAERKAVPQGSDADGPVALALMFGLVAVGFVLRSLFRS